MTSPTPPAALPSEEERFAAASLGFNPHDASTWAVDIVNRLVRIRSERGDQAFAQEVANLTTSPTHSPFNACCYRDHCKALEARALAAEAALAAERERCIAIVDAQVPDWVKERSGPYWEGYRDAMEDAAEDMRKGSPPRAAAIRAQGE